MLPNIDLTYLLFSIASALIALSIHEFAHGYAAYKLGDHTAANLGRLTLNPIKHIDPVGALFMVLFRFGWAKPVPINPRNFQNPKRDFAISSLAGPISNIITALISTLIYVIFSKVLVFTIDTAWSTLVYNTCYFFSVFAALNVGLGVFNLIPVPPFDGSRIIGAILPDKIYWKVMKYERQIYWAVIGWLFLGAYAYNALISVPFIGSNEILSAILRIFDLSGIISDAIGGIYTGMISLWRLIPILK
jgi:Zn-dependent protease